MLTAGVHGLERAELRRGQRAERALEQGLRQAEHRVQRRPQLVAHAGEERRLGAASLDGLAFTGAAGALGGEIAHEAQEVLTVAVLERDAVDHHAGSAAVEPTPGGLERVARVPAAQIEPRRDLGVGEPGPQIGGDDLLGAGAADDRHERRVGLDDRAVHRGAHDAADRVLEHAAVARLAVAQRGLGQRVLRHVAHGADDRAAAVGIEQLLAAALEDPGRAVGPEHAVAHGGAAAGWIAGGVVGDRRASRAIQRAAIVGVDPLEHAGQGRPEGRRIDVEQPVHLGAPAQLAGVQIDRVAADAGDPLRLVEHVLRLLPRPLGEGPLGHVLHDHHDPAGRSPTFAQRRGVEPQVHRRAIAGPARHLDRHLLVARPRQLTPRMIDRARLEQLPGRAGQELGHRALQQRCAPLVHGDQLPGDHVELGDPDRGLLEQQPVAMIDLAQPPPRRVLGHHQIERGPEGVAQLGLGDVREHTLGVVQRAQVGLGLAGEEHDRRIESGGAQVGRDIDTVEHRVQVEVQDRQPRPQLEDLAQRLGRLVGSADHRVAEPLQAARDRARHRGLVIEDVEGQGWIDHGKEVARRQLDVAEHRGFERRIVRTLRRGGLGYQIAIGLHQVTYWVGCAGRSSSLRGEATGRPPARR